MGDTTTLSRLNVEDHDGSSVGLALAGTVVTSSAAELNVNDGLTATAAELNSAADTSTRIVTEAGTALSITVALHDKRFIVMSETGGDAAATYTLPASAGTGATFKFFVGVINTSNYLIKVANASDVMYGNIITSSTGDTPDLGQPWTTGATADTITLNGTTTGGVAIGDWVELTDIITNVWAVTGVTTSSGTEATPFSATVS